ncbi:MAG: hypothetical protein L6V84_02200 [Oscillospiraceae bacterium]|nr:MAG: hypothetical protein L6V84_02200 [Oscillospiraceae bacterium]
MKAQGYETLDYQTLADTETSLYTCSEAEYTKKADRGAERMRCRRD